MNEEKINYESFFTKSTMFLLIFLGFFVVFLIAIFFSVEEEVKFKSFKIATPNMYEMSFEELYQEIYKKSNAEKPIIIEMNSFSLKTDQNGNISEFKIRIEVPKKNAYGEYYVSYLRRDEKNPNIMTFQFAEKGGGYADSELKSVFELCEVARKKNLYKGESELAYSAYNRNLNRQKEYSCYDRKGYLVKDAENFAGIACTFIVRGIIRWQDNVEIMPVLIIDILDL